MRSFTRRTVATVAATAMSAGLFLIAAPAMAATPAQAATSTVAAAHDYDYEDAEVVAVLEGAIKVRLDTGEIITLRVGPGCPILKGGVLVDLDSIHVGLEVDIDLGLSVNILGIIKIHGVAGLISIG
ncbi:hypothetical protein [Crossiella sp. NPDC003009]